MIPLLISLATVAAYLMIGFTWSKRMIPKWWELSRQTWMSDGVQRDSVKAQYFWKATAWPWFMLTDIDALIDAGDPRKIKREADERERRIRDLERELGIGPSVPTTEKESLDAIREMFRFKNGGIK